LIDEEYLLEKMDEVDRIFLQHGAPDEVYGMDNERLEELIKKANAAGIEFVPLKQRHVGSDELPKVIKSIEDYLKSSGVEIYTGVTVVDINPDEKYILTDKGEKHDNIRSKIENKYKET